jgi:hypothetical protein
VGIYEITINPDDLTVNLNPKRITSVGESYIVSGIGFFTSVPCPDCLKLKIISLVPGGLRFTFTIRHPFNPGNTSEPPSAVNRRDLDVFDLAMLIVPTQATPSTYPLTGMDIYSGIIKNTDGYTTELSEVTSDESAMPYVLVIDESDATTHQWNKFAMGASADFDVDFVLTGGTSLRFDMFLTMGYGASAKRPQRLDPKYYNPEFNRKAAWKINVIPPQGENPPERGNTWDDVNSATPYNVTVEIYDWQTGATVATAPNFADADPSEVFAESEVESVTVEIPGMNDTPQVVTAMTSGTGFPNSPLIYIVPIANENLLPIGEYAGLVKVQDTRAPLTPGDGRDFLIDSPDGIQLNNYTIPEYTTYQTFTATVVDGLEAVGNVTITTNRWTNANDYKYINDTGAPWTLHWDAAAGAAEYAIFWDNDPSDGLINDLQLVGVTTGTDYGVPSSHRCTLEPVKITYIVRSRKTMGNPFSESENSELAFIMMNNWITLDDNEIPGRGNDGEGWSVAVEKFTSDYNYNPHIIPPSICQAISSRIGRSTCGNYQGILIETPVIPDSSVRFFEFASRIAMDWGGSGFIIGSCSTNPGAPWSSSHDFEWALASNSAPYFGYDSTITPIRTTFDDVDYSSYYCWNYNSPGWTYPLLGGDINATANPADAYVGIMAASVAGLTEDPGLYVAHMVIMIY